MRGTTFSVIYGYVNSFDKFITLQARTALDGDAVGQMVSAYATELLQWNKDGKIVNLTLNIRPDTFIISSPMLATWRNPAHSHLNYEAWIVPDTDDVWQFIERTPSQTNGVDVPFNQILFFPVDGRIPSLLTQSNRFAITGSERAAIIRKVDELPENLQ